ncbi:MAG: hypothetical protein ACKPDI_12295, partial [Actinomycetota bacterium]
LANRSSANTAALATIAFAARAQLDDTLARALELFRSRRSGDPGNARGLAIPPGLQHAGGTFAG